MDATFKIVPRQGTVFNMRSAQVFNIIADYNGHAVILFTVVMTSRRLQLYLKTLDVIKQHYPEFNPPQMMADYETAMRAAFKSRFPSSKLYGCRFHFAKAIFSKVKNCFHLGPYLRPRGNKTQKDLSSLVRQYMALPLLRPEDMKAQVERIGKEIRAITTVHCTTKVVRKFNRLHNYVVKYWMQFQGPANISVYGATHKTNNVHERLNGMMNGEFAMHPTLFAFMNMLKTLFYENGICVINQVSQGRAEKHPQTAAARRLSEKSEKAEADYRDNVINAEKLLKEAAAHYDEDRLMEIMGNASDANQTAQDTSNSQATAPINEDSNQNSQSSGAEVTQSSSQNSDDVMVIEDREEQIRNDPDLRDLDNDEWQITNWSEPDAVSPSNEEEEDLTLLHPEAPPGGRQGRAAPDVNELVVPICILCNESPPSQQLLKNCGHTFCSNCVNRPEFLICPVCRSPKGETVTNHVGTLMLAWKRDVAASFGASRWEARPEEDGRRPGDRTVQQDLQQMSEELARSLEMANQMLPPGMFLSIFYCRFNNVKG